MNDDSNNLVANYDAYTFCIDEERVCNNYLTLTKENALPVR